jgi:hypothetical protein
MAWALHLQELGVTVALFSAALVIAVLRVVVGYHTWAQVIVGGALGAAMAAGWMAAGSFLKPLVPGPLAYAAVYATYLLGSFFFIFRKMAKWSSWNERHAPEASGRDTAGDGDAVAG